MVDAKVGSKQMQEIRIKLRGKATILMGKNTMIRTCLRNHMSVNEELGLDKLLTAINGNIGFVFCHGDMDEIRKTVTENKVASILLMVDISPSFTFGD